MKTHINITRPMDNKEHSFKDHDKIDQGVWRLAVIMRQTN